MKTNEIAQQDALRILGFWFVAEKAKQEPQLKHYNVSAYDAQIEAGKAMFWIILGTILTGVTALILVVDHFIPNLFMEVGATTTIILSVTSIVIGIRRNEIMSPTTKDIAIEWSRHFEASRMVAHYLTATLNGPGTDRDKIKKAVTESLEIIAGGLQKAEAFGFTKPAKALRDLFAKVDKFGQAVGAGKADWKMLGY